MECRERGEKETVIFPGEFHEIAVTLHVSHDDLGHELLRRVHVPAHSWSPRERDQRPESRARLRHLR